MAYQNLVCFSSIFILMRIIEIKNCSRPGAASQVWCHVRRIIYLHSMASQRMNERFNKYLDPFVNLCHACGHKPTSVLLVSTLWYDGGENIGTTEMYEKTLELEEHFQKAASSTIHFFLIPCSVRFDGSHDRVSVCNAIDLLILNMMLVLSLPTTSQYMFGDRQPFRIFPSLFILLQALLLTR